MVYRSTKSEKFRNEFSKKDAAELVRSIDGIVSGHAQSATATRQCLLVGPVVYFLEYQDSKNESI